MKKLQKQPMKQWENGRLSKTKKKKYLKHINKKAEKE